MRTSLLLLITLLSFNIKAQRFLEPVFNEVQVDSNVIYGSSVTQAGLRMELKMDVFQPAEDSVKDRPLVILAHGGFFLFGDKNWFWPLCEELAKRGYVAATIQYRLIDVIDGDSVWTPKRAVIDAVYDMKAAVRYFNKDHEEANQYAINPENIFISGLTQVRYIYLTIDMKFSIL